MSKYATMCSTCKERCKQPSFVTVMKCQRYAPRKAPESHENKSKRKKGMQV